MKNFLDVLSTFSLSKVRHQSLCTEYKIQASVLSLFLVTVQANKKVVTCICCVLFLIYLFIFLLKELHKWTTWQCGDDVSVLIEWIV